MNSRYQVYVLENPKGKRYIGLSEDPICRLKQHNAGISTWTAKNRPWKLIWLGEGMPLTKARRLESLMKKQKGGIGLENLMAHYGL